MKIDRITIRVGKIIPTGPYQNIRPEVELAANLEETTVEDGIKLLTDKVNAALELAEARLMGIKLGEFKTQEGKTVTVKYKSKGKTSSVKEIEFDDEEDDIDF